MMLNKKIGKIGVDKIILKGTSVLVVREFAMKLLSIFGQLVLVRLLLPQYFGIFAILSFVLNGANLFADLGLSLAIIQKKNEPSQKELSTVFYLKLALAVIIVIVLFIGSSYLHLIYTKFSSEDIFILRLLSLTFFLQPLQSILVALLERKLKYHEISVIDLIGLFFYYFVAIVLALDGFGLWSFVWALIVKELVELLVSVYYLRWFPSLYFKISDSKEIINLGKYLQIGSIFSFVHTSIIPVIAGIKTSTYNVGLLDWGSNVSSIPKAFADNLGRVSFSSYSKIQDEKKMIAKSIEKSFGVLSIITIFIILIVFGFGSQLIHYLLTDKWLPALPALYWFIAASFFINGVGPLGQAILAVGETKKMFIASTILIPIEWILSYILLSIYGFVGIAIGSFLGTIFMFFYFILIGNKIGIKLNVKEMFFSKTAVFIFGMVSMLIINQVIPSSILYLIIKILLFSVIYILLCSFILNKELGNLLAVVKSSLHN